uniref:Putative kunitz-bpti protein n=1 Tax=Amblyomma americanum TaxID=6943 RepID=A0A0C9R5A5_AMBAM
MGTGSIMAIWKPFLLLGLLALCSARRPTPYDSRCRSSRPALQNDCYHRSYVFDRSTRQCSWTCGRGPFVTKIECDSVCRSAAVCAAPRPFTQCQGKAFPVYYLNNMTGKCHLDMGCSYRGNNFPTLGECQRTCKAGKY